MYSSLTIAYRFVGKGKTYSVKCTVCSVEKCAASCTRGAMRCVRVELIDLQFFYGQATKGVRWMPWQREAMKDAVSCDKLRGAANGL